MDRLTYLTVNWNRVRSRGQGLVAILGHGTRGCAGPFAEHSCSLPA